MLTDFQLGGTGRAVSTPAHGRYSSGGSPVITPYGRGQPIPHNSLDPLDSDDHQHPLDHEMNYTAPTPSSNYIPASSSRNTTVPYNRTPPSQRKEDSDYLFNDKRSGRKEVEFDILQTPSYPNKSLAGGGMIAGSIGTSKGYYDGLLDIPTIPSATSTRPAGITPHREERTSVRSPGKKPVYSWSLPGFGREDEATIPSSTPSAAVN